MENHIESRSLESLENKINDYERNNPTDFFWMLILMGCAFGAVGIANLFKTSTGLQIIAMLVGGIAGLFLGGWVVEALTPIDIRAIREEISRRKKPVK